MIHLLLRLFRRESDEGRPGPVALAKEGDAHAF
jgi:hypothetical protein